MTKGISSATMAIFNPRRTARRFRILPLATYWYHDGVVEINAGGGDGGFVLLDSGLAGLHAGLCRAQLMAGIGNLFFGGGAGLDELLISGEVELDLLARGNSCRQGCFCRLQVGLRLGQFGLSHGRVNTEKHITFFDRLAVAVFLGYQETAHLRVNIGVVLATQVAEPVTVVSNLLFLDFESLDFYHVCLRLGFLFRLA